MMNHAMQEVFLKTVSCPQGVVGWKQASTMQEEDEEVGSQGNKARWVTMVSRLSGYDLEIGLLL
jgi:hypothetical protein